MRYQLQIEAANVPETLAGASLSVEIFSQAGSARRILLPLTGAPVVQDVDGPGSYLVRATLPSGRLISETVAMAEKPDPQGEVRGMVVLDLKEHDALADFWREAESLLQIAAAIQAKQEKNQQLPAWLQAALKDFAKRNWDRAAAWVGGALGQLIARTLGPPAQPATRGSDGTSAALPESGPAPDSGSPSGSAAPISYDWGTYLGWASAPSEARRKKPPKLHVRRGGSGTIGPNGEVPPPQRGGNRIEPCLIQITETAGPVSLVVWLPGSKQRPAKIVVDPDRAAHRSGSTLLAFPDPEDPITATPFSYVAQGALEEARTVLPTLVASLDRDSIISNPNQGLLAAYVLYKLRDRHVDGVIARLRAQRPDLPDVHVLAGAQLIAAGRSEDAVGPVKAALEFGVPIYTEGVRLLRDVANFVRDLHPNDKSLRDNAYRASCLAAAANFESELTCLRLGDDLAVEFVGNAEAALAGAGAAARPA